MPRADVDAADPFEVIDDAEQAEAEAEEAETRAADARARAQAARQRHDDRADHDVARRPRRLPGRRPRLSTVFTGVALLCATALIAVGVAMTVHYRTFLDDQQRAAEFTAAAEQAAVTLMSIDAAHPEQSVQRIIDGSTGKFRDDFRSASDDFVKAARDSKSSTVATAQAAAVDSMTDDTAVVLVAATSTLTDADGNRGEPRSWRLSVALTRDGGQMKMSSVEFVP